MGARPPWRAAIGLATVGRAVSPGRFGTGVAGAGRGSGRPRRHCAYGATDSRKCPRRSTARRLVAADPTGGLPGVCPAQRLRCRGKPYPILLPYAERNITFGVPQPVICLGSASLHLALLATVTCRWEVAETHFAAAQLAHDRLRARAFHARADYESARMLIRRGRA